jgi:hypothetical protein
LKLSSLAVIMNVSWSRYIRAADVAAVKALGLKPGDFKHG